MHSRTLEGDECPAVVPPKVLGIGLVNDESLMIICIVRTARGTRRLGDLISGIWVTVA